MRSMGVSSGRRTLLATLLIALFGGTAQAAIEPGELFGRAYFSTAVTKAGAPHPLFEGTEVRVDFEHRKTYDVVRWDARCNIFGARVKVTDERLKLPGLISGTSQFCSKQPRRQDRWLVRFFASDPKWGLDKRGLLRLESGSRVMELRRRPAQR